MAHDPKWLREAARLLSTLLQTPAEELDDYHRERLERRAGVDATGLSDAQAILLWLSEAIDRPDANRWKGIRHARELLDNWKEGCEELAGQGEQETVDDVALSAAGSPPPVATATPGPAQPIVRPPAKAAAAAPAASPWAPQPLPVSQPNPVAAAPGAPVPAPPVGAAPAVATAATDATKKAAPWTSSPLNATVMASSKPREQTLPFEQGKTAKPRKLVLEPHAAFGQTAPVEGRPATSPALPFETSSGQVSRPAKAADAPEVVLTLEQYASFCAERDTWPDHADQIRSRYHLDTVAEQQLRAYYGRQLDADADAKTRFDSLLAHYREQLKG